jgi:hypothetical protein
MMIINPKSCLAASNFYTIPAEKITTATTWTGNEVDLLDKHLNVTCI